MRNLIFCEVTCGRCGRAANACGYYSPERIKKLKAETKTWVEDDSYRVLCPTCKIAVESHKTSTAVSELMKRQAYIDKQRKEVEESLEDPLF